jgi:predicted RNA-binding protein with PUA-like domain
MSEKKYWLMKTEPDVFSIDDLKRKKRAPWDGVRNYQARNFMRDGMRVGDMVLFYHSNAKPMGVAGLARVSRAAFPDFTAWDRSSPYFDPRSTKEKPMWMMVEVEFVSKFDRIVTLDELKASPFFSDMMLTRRGSRLSVQPVSAAHAEAIIKLGAQPAPARV